MVRAGVPLEEAFQAAERVKGEKHELGDDENRFRLGITQVSSDLVLEELGDGPKNGADQWADQPHVAQELGFDPRLDLALKVDGAAIVQTHSGRADEKVVREQHAVGEHETALGGAGAAVAEAGRNPIENR